MSYYYKLIDNSTCDFIHLCTDDSRIQNEFSTRYKNKLWYYEKIIKKGRLQVLANGSICGVDTNQFRPNIDLKEKIRDELGIPTDSILLLFLGRLNKDKGILDLAKVLNNLNNHPDYEKKIQIGRAHV